MPHEFQQTYGSSESRCRKMRRQQSDIPIPRGNHRGSNEDSRISGERQAKEQSHNITGCLHQSG